MKNKGGKDLELKADNEYFWAIYDNGEKFWLGDVNFDFTIGKYSTEQVQVELDEFPEDKIVEQILFEYNEDSFPFG